LAVTRRSPTVETSRTRAPVATIKGTRSDDCTAQHFELPGATQHTSPSFFRQKLMPLRHS
jgi:hypothetical protein